jgi:hypothetical protein
VEPVVSLEIAKGQNPAAMLTADPEDDPPEIFSGQPDVTRVYVRYLLAACRLGVLVIYRPREFDLRTHSILAVHPTFGVRSYK